jgi:hypothetical protein
MNRRELVLPAVSCTTLGIGNTEFPQIIKCKLERVRGEVFYY